MYSILQHTADVRIHVEAPTLEALFGESVDAVMATVAVLRGEDEDSISISVESKDVTSLLVDFLSEVLLQFHLLKQAYRVAKISLADSRATATLTAQRVLEFGEDVKAVTYHEADVRETAKGWETTLVLDI